MGDNTFQNNLFQNKSTTSNVFQTPGYQEMPPSKETTKMKKSLLNHCKMLCFLRCCYAIGLSVFSQGVLFIILIRCINFNILHPLNWMITSVVTLLSISSWLRLLPVLLAAILNGYFLAKFHLAIQHYYPTRFVYIIQTICRKFCLLCIQLLIGCLTSIMYMQYLDKDYSTFTYTSGEQNYLNSKYFFMTGAGTVAAFSHFIQENLKTEFTVKFPVIQERVLVKLRSLFYTTLYGMLRKSLTVCLYYMIGYWIIGSYFGKKCANFFGSSLDKEIYTAWSIIKNPSLLIYTWLLIAQIHSGMLLMQEIFSIVLSEEMHFPICHDTTNIESNSNSKKITLVEALSNVKVPLIQKLAAWDLYTIAFNGCFERRKVIYILSVPGGHPHNWNELSSQCLVVLESFLDNLQTANKTQLQMNKKAQTDNLGNVISPIGPQKLFIQKMNESLGIRRLMTPPLINQDKPHMPYSGAFTSTPTQNSVYRSISKSASSPTAATLSSNGVDIKDCKKKDPQNINEQFHSYCNQIIATLQKKLLNLPGIYYLFHKSETSLFLHTLSNVEMIIWILQGLGGICTASLHEDSYGVVQSILPQFLSILLNLNEELEKIEIFLSNYQKSENPNLNHLKKSVNRVLHKVTCAFGDYLHDFIDDTYKLNKLKRYSKYEM